MRSYLNYLVGCEKIVSEDLIKNVAELSKLDLTSLEISEFKKDFDEILEYFKVIDSAKVDESDSVKIVPVSDNDFFLREDKAVDKKLHEKCLSQSKHKKDDFFKGPKAF